MDLILNLLKQLSASLSPTQFLMVLVLIVVSIFLTIKFLAGKQRTAGGVLGMLSGYGETQLIEQGVQDKRIEDISAKLELGLDSMHQNFTSITTALDDIKVHIRENEQLYRKQMSDLLIVKRDLDKFAVHVTAELTDIKHGMRMKDVQDAVSFENLKNLFAKSNELLVQANNELQKLDDFMKSVIPEFRHDHKDISKEISDLSRDIALVERTIQNQMSSIQNISLR